MKIEFVSPAAEREFKGLPKHIKERFALDLKAVQKGRTPFSKIKSLSSVGAGAIELIKNGSPAYRCIYVAKFDDTIYILHSFVKTTNGVDKPAMKVASQRYKEIKRQT